MSANASHLERAGSWFLASGIQQDSGGVARYYRVDAGKYQPIATEITGYAASTLVYLHALTGEQAYLAAARRAAEFLTQTAWDPALEAFPFECPDHSGVRPPAYFFDSGIIIRGLLAVWRATGVSDFLQTAITCGRSMAKDFVTQGSIHPVLSLPDKQPMLYAASWSRHPGCYQLKSAMAWHALSAATGEKEFIDHYEGALAQAVSSHDSFLPGTSESDRVMDRLHAYCYFLEGLLPYAKRPECGQALARGMERTMTLLREVAPLFARSDVYAQLLRLRLYADRLGTAPLDKSAAENEITRIAEFQFAHADPKIHGGFCFGRRTSIGLLPFVNPVSTAFCLQALEMWRQYLADEFTPDVDMLI